METIGIGLIWGLEPRVYCYTQGPKVLLALAINALWIVRQKKQSIVGACAKKSLIYDENAESILHTPLGPK